MRFRYVPGRSVRDAGKVLAYEPELFGDVRLVLFQESTLRAAQQTMRGWPDA